LILVLKSKNLTRISTIFYIGIAVLISVSCKNNKPDNGPDAGSMQILKTKIGTVNLYPTEKTLALPVDQSFLITFGISLDTTTVKNNVEIRKDDNSLVNCQLTYQDDKRTIVLLPVQNLDNSSNYSLTITSKIKGANGETFPGITYLFETIAGIMKVENITLNGLNFKPPVILKEITTKNSTIIVDFSQPLNPSTYQAAFSLSGSHTLTYSISNDNKRVTITIASELTGYSRFYFIISSGLTAANGFTFEGFSNSFYTTFDPTPKFPLISDEELLTLVQEQTFKYYWDYAHPACGLSRERYGSGDIVTIGGSGFGIMALMVGVERGFITRSEVLARMDKILHFLETCDRFHGAWPHWINGSTGKTIPFGTNDNGADLVETAFMIQGLLAFRQYMNSGDPAEQIIINRITALWEEVEWDWFARGGTTLYWHWSPDKGWIMNMQIRGVNETLICYVLGIASPTHGISASSYKQGYMQNGSVVNGKTFYGYKLQIGWDLGGPLFFTHYSFLGLDPRNLSDQYVNYWEQNINHTLINRAYCIANPKNYVGYGENSWGLTASDDQNGYSAHSPTNDLGVITPTAALSSMPYTPTESMAALKYFYYILGDKLWGPYGFYDAFNVTQGWWATSYISIDQGPIIVMIENYRTQLVWNEFMSDQEIQTALTSMGFTY
jgi:hypothetical protein